MGRKVHLINKEGDKLVIIINMEIQKDKLPIITDEELKEIMLPTDKLVEIALNDFDEQLRLDKMKEWSAEEQTKYLCPNGVMTIEEFRALGHKMIDEFYDEQNEEE